MGAETSFGRSTMRRWRTSSSTPASAAGCSPSATRTAPPRPSTTGKYVGARARGGPSTVHLTRRPDRHRRTGPRRTTAPHRPQCADVLEVRAARRAGQRHRRGAVGPRRGPRPARRLAVRDERAGHDAPSPATPACRRTSTGWCWAGAAGRRRWRSLRRARCGTEMLGPACGTGLDGARCCRC